MRIRDALDRIEKGCAFAFKADIFSRALRAGTLAFVGLHGIGLTCYIGENSHRKIRKVYFTRLVLLKIQHFTMSTMSQIRNQIANNFVCHHWSMTPAACPATADYTVGRAEQRRWSCAA